MGAMLNNAKPLARMAPFYNRPSAGNKRLGVLLLTLLLLQGCGSLPWQSESNEEQTVVPVAEASTAENVEADKQAAAPPQMIIETCIPEDKQGKKASVKPEETRPTTRDGLPILGGVERVRLEPLGEEYKARIDTGATGSSLDARNIARFERDGEPWVRFTTVSRETGEEQEHSRKLVRQVPIKGRGVEIHLRPVVILRAVIGDIDQQVEFSLTDRSRFKYPVLIGRNLLRDNAIVDVSRRYTVKPAKQ
jgi:hypothetical protein